MKALLLASTLGLTLLTNTAIAATSVEDNSVWRNDATSTVSAEMTKTSDWERTEFAPADSLETENEVSSIFRKVRMANIFRKVRM